MTTLASTYLADAKNALTESHDRLVRSGDLPDLTMSERKIMLKLLTLMEFDIAELRRHLA